MGGPGHEAQDRPTAAPGAVHSIVDAEARLEVRALDGGPLGPPPGLGTILLGVHRAGPLPRSGLEVFDVLLSADPAAPAPWVGVAPGDLEAAITALQVMVAIRPVASLALTQVLRLSLTLSFEAALTVESLAYSMLLAGCEFRDWRRENPVRNRPASDAPRVRLDRDGDTLVIALSRPDARNAVDARMRDELVEALEFAAIDPGAPPVRLVGDGAAYCAGGDLDEFGTASDPAAAHVVRMARSPARLAYLQRDRLHARLHGACIGAGIEIPAAAGRVTARPDSWFQLPEVAMGLIPGAGGTATLPRRIGRHRTAWLALTGARLDAAHALEWGLIDAMEHDG